jgi:phage-related protein
MADEVGSASITITPDMSYFEEDLKAKLGQAIEQTGEENVQVGTTVDDTQVAATGDEAGKKFADPFKTAVAESTKNTTVGPDDTTTAEKGSSTGGKFADAFKLHLDAALKDLPDIKVGMDTTEDEVKLAEIKAEMEALSHQVINVDITESDARRTVDDLASRLDNLKKHSNIGSVVMDAEAASSELGKLTSSLDGASSGAGGLSSSLEESAGSISPMIPLVGLLATALVPLAGAVAGIGIGFAGMATAAGAGIGAFGLAALPVFTQVSTAMQQITADQQAITRATTTTAKNTAITQLASDVQNLSPGIASLVGLIMQAKSAFMQWDQQFQPEIISVFSAAISDMMPLLNDITPLVKAGAAEFHDIFEQIGLIAQQPDFKSFISFLAAQAGPAINTILAAVEQFGQGFADMLQKSGPLIAMFEKGFEGLTAIFLNWVDDGGFQKFVNWFIANGPTIVKDVVSLIDGVGKLAVALAPVGMVLLNFIGVLGRLMAFLAGSPALLGGLTAGLGALAIVLVGLMDSNPVGLIITAIALLVVGITELVTHWRQVWSEIKQVFDEAVTFLRSGFGSIVLMLLGPIGWIALLAVHWQAAWSAIRSITNDVWHAIDNDVFHPLERFFSAVIPPVLDVFKSVWSAIWPVITTTLTIAWDIIKVIFDAIRIIALLPVELAIIAFQAVWSAIWPVISSVLNAAWSFMKPIFNFFVTLGFDVVKEALGIFRDLWNVAWSVISTILSATWAIMAPVFGFIKTLGIDIIKDEIGFLRDVWNAVWPVISGALNIAWGIMGPIFGFIKTLGLDIIKAAIKDVGDVWNQIWSAMATAVSVAGTLISGAIDVIKSLINDVIGVINTLINAYDKIPFAEHISDIPTIGGPGPAQNNAPDAPAPHRAGGGPVDANTPYIVGENGPELFLSPNAGTIIPNSALPRLGDGVLGTPVTGVGSSGFNYQPVYSFTINGSGLNQAELTAALNTAVSQHDATLLQLVGQHSTGNS